MSKWLYFVIALVLAGAAGWYIWTYTGKSGARQDQQSQQQRDANQNQSGKKSGPPSKSPASKTEVSFIEIQPVVISRSNQLPGRVVSYQVAEIRPQVSGIIQSRLFEEGSYVEEGQQLYQIDPARYEADHQIATANLQNAKAQVRNAQNLVDRFKKLIDYNAVSKQEYDDALASLDQARAAVALAEAEVRNARINLDYTKVYAPISGYISPSSVTRGALVTAQQEVALATVRQLDPVYVDLSQSAAEARSLQEQLTTLRLKADKTEYEVTLYLGNTQQIYPLQGTLDATDLAVDVQTGAIRLRSVLPNPDNILLPGMFVRARIEDVGRAKEIIIPQKSVKIEPDGSKSVWIVGPDNKAQKRPIQTGVAFENNWVVLGGLNKGDKVIVEGAMMLNEGAALKPEKIKTDAEDMIKSVPADPVSDSPPLANDPAQARPADNDSDQER